MRVLSSGFDADGGQAWVEGDFEPPLRMCSCVTVNGVHHRNPGCQVHGDGSPGLTQTASVDAATGEVEFRG